MEQQQQPTTVRRKRQLTGGIEGAPSGFSRPGFAVSKAAKRMKVAPLINHKVLGEKARQGKISAQAAATIFDLLCPLPARFVYAVCRLVEQSKDVNQFYRQHQLDFDEIKASAEELMNNEGVGLSDELQSVYPYQAVVIAAYMGATTLPSEDECVSSSTYLDPTPLIQKMDPKHRDETTLRAVQMVSWPITDQGTINCFCGKAAAYRKATSYGKIKRSSFFDCVDQQCRMHFTAEAMAALTGLKGRYNVEKFPALFCPLHPEQEIRISEAFEKDSKGNQIGQYLKARCAFYKNENNSREFCVNEVVGNESDYNATNLGVWKIMDFLACA